VAIQESADIITENTEEKLSDQLTLRPFRDEDFEPVAALIADLWFPQADPEFRPELGRIELAHHLRYHSWSLVVDAGKPLGIVLAAIPGQALDERRWQQRIDAGLAQLPSPQQRDAASVGGLKILTCEQTISSRLLAEEKPFSDGTIELLIVSSQLRGLGLGKTLFSRARDYLKGAGARGYHLMTDDDCDFNFYEHIGMQRVAEDVCTLPDGSLGIYAYAETFGSCM
jgi:ribosomal protein S18 acetylase RimI-like enzyme